MATGSRKPQLFKQYLTRLSLPLLLAALVGLIVACVNLSIDVTGTTLETEIRRSAQTTAQQVCANLDYRLRQIEDSAQTLLGTVYPYLNTATDDLESQLNQFNEMGRIIAGYLGRHMVDDIRLYCPDDRIYAHQRDTFFSLDDLESDADFQALLGERRSGLFWQQTRSVYQGLEFGGVRVIKDMISCVGVVISQSHYDKPTGVLYMDVSVQSVCELLNVADGMTLTLVSAEGKVLASPDGELIGTYYEGFDKLTPTNAHASVMLDDNVLAYARLESSGWYVFNKASHAIMSPSGARMLNLLRLLAGVSVLLAVGIMLLAMFWLSMSRTQKTIRRAIDALSEGEGAPHPRDSLTTSANQLALTAQRITEERYRDRLAIVEYQMKSLQSQIKPHFLYNTLDVIRWMIVDGDSENSAWMVNALSKYLRLSINKGPDIVCLREEVELTRAYLAIMQKRFKGQFRVSYDLDEAAMEQKLPKFSLQPLTENAIIHGLLNNVPGDRRLMIRAWREEGKTWIEIEDNGAGMDAATVEKLLRPGMDADSGYGVANVRKRLAHFGCGEGDFRVSSQPGSGTCVTVILN